MAFPLGTGMEYWANPVNPVTARERHRESIDIILKAWTVEGPTSYYGGFRAQPPPASWRTAISSRIRPATSSAPAAGGIGLAIELGFGYSAVFVTRQRASELSSKLRRRSADFGHQCGRISCRWRS